MKTILVILFAVVAVSMAFMFSLSKLVIGLLIAAALILFCFLLFLKELEKYDDERFYEEWW